MVEPAHDALVDWAVVCDLAHFDSLDRLCLFGIETAGRISVRCRPAFTVSPLPCIFTTAGSATVTVCRSSSRPPQGEGGAADEVLDFAVESRGEYVIVHMPGFQLTEEGIYRYEVACGAGVELATCEVNVRSQPHRVAGVHLHGAY